MHVVFLNQYYPPDVAPTGVMLRDVAERMWRAGCQVSVISSGGGYGGGGGEADREDGCVNVVRLGATRFGRGSVIGKLLDYASYYAGVAWKLLRMNPRPDRVVAMTTPPYLSLLARAVSKIRGGEHAHWVMDLYPDVMVAHGMLRQGGIRHRVLDWLAGLGFGGKRSAGVLSLGPDMDAKIARFGVRHDWIPLWSGKDGTRRDAAEDGCRLRAERSWGDDELVVMYSGNMGLGHDFDGLLAATLRPEMTGVRLVFAGGGRRRREVADFMMKHPEVRVELSAYAPEEILEAHLASADVHVVSLRPEWNGTMVPSKLQGVFAVGRPVIFLGDAQSSIGVWVLESGAGRVVPPKDVDAIVMALAEMRDSHLRIEMSGKARDFAERVFDKSRNSSRVADFFMKGRFLR